MVQKKGGDLSKKALGQARKADAAAAKAAAEDAKKAAVEDEDWKRGAKNSAKKEAEAAKKAELARKKAEKDALAAEDDINTPGRALPKKSKTAQPKPSRGLDSALSQLSVSDKTETPLYASGIDAGLDLFMALDPSKNIKLDQHPERRFPAAFAAFKDRREEEMKQEGIRLNRSQRLERIRKEFEKSPENPFLQAHLNHNATMEEKEGALQAEKERIESSLTKKN